MGNSDSEIRFQHSRLHPDGLVGDEDENENAAKSDWSGKITITQNQGDQTAASIAKSTYSMDVASALQITTMYTAGHDVCSDLKIADLQP